MQTSTTDGHNDSSEIESVGDRTCIRDIYHTTKSRHNGEQNIVAVLM